MAVIDQYFKYLVEAGGSDLHLSEGQPPKIRVNGTISAISDENLEGQSFKNLLAEICDSQAFQKYLEEGDLDFAYEMDETSRFRCNYFRQQHGLGARLPSHSHKNRHAGRTGRAHGRQGIRPHEIRAGAGHGAHGLR